MPKKVSKKQIKEPVKPDEEDKFKLGDLPDAEAEGDPYGPDANGDEEEEEKKRKKKAEDELSEALGPPPPTYMLLREPIFQVGTWNDDVWTEDDVKGLIANFYALRNSFEPNMGAGHDTYIHRIHYGERSLGWVKELYYEAPILLADLEVDSEVYERDLKTKRLRYKSIRVANNFERDGKKYGRVLKSLDLLGVSTPAVGDLGAIQLPYADDNTDTTIDLENMYNKEGDKMPADIKKIDPEIVALKKELATATASLKEFADLKDKDDKYAELDAKVAKFEEMATRVETLETAYASAKTANEMLVAKDIARDVAASADKLVSAGKLLPVQKLLFCEILTSLDKTRKLTYSDGEEKKEFNQADALIALFETAPAQVDLSADTATGSDAEAGTAGDKPEPKPKSRFDLERYSEKEGIPIEGQATLERAKVIEKELKCSFQDALIKAYAEELSK